MDGSPPVVAAQQVKRKQRPVYSCLPCHQRKVKVNQSKPNATHFQDLVSQLSPPGNTNMSLSGPVPKCTFPRSAEEQNYISQSEYITQLEERCRTLERRLAHLEAVRQLVIHQANEASSSREQSHDSAEIGLLHEDEKEDKDPASNHPEKKSEDEDEDSETDGTSSIPMEYSPGAAILDIFIERLIEDCCPLSKRETGVKRFILSDASQMRSRSELLQVAFENTALMFVGRTWGDRDIEMAGHRHNMYAIRLMRRSLRRCSGKPVPLDVFVAAFIFIIREVFTGDSNALMKHLVGAAQLLQSRKPEEHQTGISHAIFLDYRIYWIAGSILLRRPSFLVHPDWMKVPWAHKPKDLLQQLLDIGAEVPCYLFQIDKYQSQVASGQSSYEDLLNGHSSPGAWAQTLDSRLERWYHHHIPSYQHGSITESDHRLDASFPTFACHDSRDGHIFTPTILIYPDLLLTTVMCYYWALRITVVGANPTPSPRSLRYEWACNICRSLEAYITKGPRCFIYRILYPIIVAYQTFERDSVERCFVVQLCRRLDELYQVNVFLNIMAQLGDSIELPGF
ncbi:uncharacterized protein BP01DRAFT_427354 [Aspergillus saccharolyticus JOP 1030-1]|uniref:C6 finger domain protein n=1 Tax=Aspergillus saccharolyticus JOP 1030-1 TaxID=1450539 RepID=A0A318Z170_9EURO|nr:hypothetical protein BP01DRAFT_427354 [Aspergillus saccharolyticus JOP 1030-1]PYH40047.1 hypothetical protein BP01DRAFT_427354 [Aspergillus saccharolyticus JOP 1030-1]